MSNYPEPRELLPIFNNFDYTYLDQNLTFRQGDLRYLQLGRAPYPTINTIIQVSPAYENIGNQRNGIIEAINYASTLSPSATNVILIDVLPATYLENGQITLPDYVYMSGRNQQSVNIVLNTLLPAGQGFFNMTNNNSLITFMTIDANTNADYCYHINGATQNILDFVNVFGGTVSVIEADTAGSLTPLNRCNVFITNTSCQQAINISNTAQMASASNFIADATFSRTKIGYNITGSNPPTGAFRTQFSSSAVIGFDIGAQLDNSAFINSLGDFFNNNTAVKLINGSKATLNIMSLNCDTNLDVDSTSSVFTNSVNFNDIDNITIADSNSSTIDYIEETEDNQLGKHILGNLTIGGKNNPSIVYIGEGSYQYSGVVMFKFDGTTYTNVVNDLRPSAGLQTTLFDDLTNSIFYVGDTQRYFSLNYDVQTAINGEVIFEYWNGSAWTAFNNMTCQAEIPYGSYEDKPFTAIEEQDTRYDIRLSGTTFNWATNAVNGTTKYWTRIRPNGTLTTSPVVNFLRVLYNSARFDRNGVSLKYGLSRSYKSIIWDYNSLKSPGSASTRPADQDLYLGENSRLGRTENSLGVGDLTGFSFFAPNDLDSSSPFRIYLAYVSDSTTASQADFTVNITLGNLHIGDQVYFTQATANGNPIRDQVQFPVPLPVNQTNGTFADILELEAPVPFIRSRDTNGTLDELFHCDIERASDSNPNNLVFIQITILYCSFAEGISYIG